MSIPMEITISVPTEIDPTRLDRYLAAGPDLGLSRNKIQWLINNGAVLVNGQQENVSHVLTGGETLTVSLPEPSPTDVIPQNIPLDLVFEDEWLAIVNKPAGMVTHPAAGVHEGTLANALVYRFASLRAITGHNRPGIVHRLDKDTSGLLVVAKDESILVKLQGMIEKREIHREYLALVCGHLTDSEGTIDLPIGRSTNERTRMAVGGTRERASVTHYERIDQFRAYDLLRVTLETGRTHQIRVHFAFLNHPVFGDPEYGGRDKWHRGIFAPERPFARKLLKVLPRQALHARKLSFVHPVTSAELSFEVPPPADFQAVLDLLAVDGR
jgi:23S rRNA pseudouridine1911/1915/1917 synthase